MAEAIADIHQGEFGWGGDAQVAHGAAEIVLHLPDLPHRIEPASRGSIKTDHASSAWLCRTEGGDDGRSCFCRTEMALMMVSFAPGQVR